MIKILTLINSKNIMITIFTLTIIMATTLKTDSSINVFKSNNVAFKIDANSVAESNEVEIFQLNSVDPKVYFPDQDEKIVFSFTNPNYVDPIVRIYNITGANVKTIALEDKSDFQISWNGKDDSDRDVVGGVYFYQVEADGQIINGSIVVVK